MIADDPHVDGQVVVPGDDDGGSGVRVVVGHWELELVLVLAERMQALQDEAAALFRGLSAGAGSGAGLVQAAAGDGHRSRLEHRKRRDLWLQSGKVVLRP